MKDEIAELQKRLDELSYRKHLLEVAKAERLEEEVRAEYTQADADCKSLIFTGTKHPSKGE